MREAIDEFRYPNRDEVSSTRRVSRRLVLAGSAAASVAATAGCLSGSPGDSTPGDADSSPDTSDTRPVTEEDTVYVFNTGDQTLSVVDVATDSVVGTVGLGATASFPANQFAPALTDSADDPLWLNVDDGVQAVAVGSLSTVATVTTGSGANWQEVTPDGSHLIVSAREPTHEQVRIGADPTAETFGAVTARIDRTDEGGRGDRDGPGPCDVTIHPDGDFAYVPDLFGDTLTVLSVDPFGIHAQVDVPAVAGETGKPWMGTVAPDGETLLVEHDEGPTGTESIWDTSDPGAPAERVRLTAEEGLGERPLTSEIGPDSEIGYVFTPGTNDVSVVDLAGGTVLERIGVGGSAFVGTWDPAHEKLYVPVQTSDEVKIIDHERRAVTDTLSVGPSPYGATAGTVRPAESVLSSVGSSARQLQARLAGTGTSYCIGRCDCGHQL